MGIRLENIVFPFTGEAGELKKVVASLASDDRLRYNESESIVVFRQGSLAIVDGLCTNKVFNDPSILEDILKEIDFVPEYLYVLCHFSFCDTFGYALFDKGKSVRSMFQDGWEELEPVYTGLPLDFEKKYLEAPYHYVDLNEEGGEKFAELTIIVDPSNPDAYYEKVYTVNDEEIRASFIGESMLHEFSEKFLGFNISLDGFDTSNPIIIQSKKKLENSDNFAKQKQSNKLFSYIKSLFKKQ